MLAVVQQGFGRGVAARRWLRHCRTAAQALNGGHGDT
jgi:hypothetical protein